MNSVESYVDVVILWLIPKYDFLICFNMFHNQNYKILYRAKMIVYNMYKVINFIKNVQLVFDNWYWHVFAKCLLTIIIFYTEVTRISVFYFPLADNNIIELQSTITVVCNANETSIPSMFIWHYPDGRNLTYTSSSIQSNNISIYFTDISDYGTYTCTVSNAIGSNSSDITFIQAGKYLSNGAFLIDLQACHIIKN